MRLHVPKSWVTEDIVGLDIGDSRITAARVDRGEDGRLVLQRAAWIECDSGASEREIAAAIRRMWRRFGMHTRTVCSCLHSRALNLHLFSHPGLTGAELAAALRLEAEEILQLPQTDIACDWLVSRAGDSAANAAAPASLDGILVAAPRREVDRHLSILRMARLSPVAVDVACMAIANLYATLRGSAGGTVCLVYLYPHEAAIAILEDGKSIYPRTLFARSAAWEDAPDYLIENVSDMLKYHQFKMRRGPIERLVLTGRIPASPDFVRNVHGAISLPVELWNPMSQVAIGSPWLARQIESEPDVRPALVMSIGLGLRREDHG